jgi:hypothetical protein
VLGVFDRGATCWAGIGIRDGGMRTDGFTVLVREPLFETGTAERMQTVEQCQWLIEDLGTYEANELLLQIEQARRGCFGVCCHESLKIIVSA